MRYPIAIEPRTNRLDCGVVIPDLPGCYSAGDTLEKAVSGADDAAPAWIDAAVDAGEAVPHPSSLETIRAKPEYAGWILSLVTIDPAALDDTSNESTSPCLIGSCGASTTKRAPRARRDQGISRS